MRIPTYTARTQRTSDMPGKRFSVRKNAEPFVRAELAKGEVAASLLDTAGEFAIQRRDMIASQQFNQAALQIEEEMRDAMLDLSKEQDFTNVLDGKNLWGQRMDRIRRDIIKTVQLPSLQKKLTHEFNLSEVTNRFKLKSVIDQKIVAGDQATLARRTENTANKYKTLSGQIKDYDIDMAKLRTTYDAGINKGRYNKDTVDNLFSVMKKDIATSVVAEYVGSNPLRALDLQDSLEQYYAKGDAKFLPQLDVGGEYTMHTLLNLSGQDALDVLTSIADDATKLSNLRDKAEKREEEIFQAGIETLKNRWNYFELPNKKEQTFVQNELSPTDSAIPGVEKFFENDPDGIITGEQIQNFIVEALGQANEIDDQFRKNVEEEEAVSSIPYADKSESSALGFLDTANFEGTLTISLLNIYKNKLSREDYLRYRTIISTKKDAEIALQSQLADEATAALLKELSNSEKFALSEFRYDAQSTDDPEIQRAKQASFHNVQMSLLDLEYDVVNLSDDDFVAKYNEPKSVSLIRKKRKEFIDDQDEIFLRGVMIDYTNYITGDTDVKFARQTGLKLPLAAELKNKNPISVLNAWYATQEDNAKNQETYSFIRSILVGFSAQGLYEVPAE
tara:strand:+ start:126 stop:1982 length:1857 start_codon:yes stop_codon:yes gene_type:complete